MPRPQALSEASAAVTFPAAPDLRQARDFCARLAAEHYENFPVASWLIPARVRPAVQAIYAFARVADDFADEPAHDGKRLQRLVEWQGMLDGCFRGEAVHPVFVALREAVTTHGLARQPFEDLLAAFRLDATRNRMPDEAALLDYCRLSANPVGRLLLALFGYDAPAELEASDAICTALQLTNHWQDVGVDAARDRIYVPLDALARFGVRERDLSARTATPALRALMRERVARARALFDAGRPLCNAVRGRFRLELRATWHGGRRILDRIEASDYDVLAARPRLGIADGLVVGWRTLAWSA